MIRTCVRLARRFIRKLQTVAVWVKDAVCSVFDRRPRVKFSNWYGKMTAQSLQSFFMNPYLPETFRNFRLSTYRPQIEFFSVEGPVAAVRKSNAALKVFYTGEDVVKNFTDYSHECIGLCDVSIGFSLDRCGENYVRFPIWHYHHFNTFDKDEILQQIRAINAFRIKKEKFSRQLRYGRYNMMIPFGFSLQITKMIISASICSISVRKMFPSGGM